MTLRASIALSTYNGADKLSRTLASIYRQSAVADCEVIVCDDGSTDDTALVCKEFTERYHNLRYLYLDRPYYCNPAAARNIAFKAATADIIIHQSDETVHITKNAIERLCDIKPDTFNIATVINATEAGEPVEFAPGKSQYTGTEWQRPFFFLGSLRRADVYYVGGYDQRFVEPGWDDNRFGDCLQMGAKLRAVYRDDIIGHHIHHERPKNLAERVDVSAALYREITLACFARRDRWTAPDAPWELPR